MLWVDGFLLLLSLSYIYNFHSYELIFLQWEEGIENVPRHSLGMVEKGFVNETSISLKNHVITTSLILLLIWIGPLMSLKQRCCRDRNCRLKTYLKTQNVCFWEKNWCEFFCFLVGCFNCKGGLWSFKSQRMVRIIPFVHNSAWNLHWPSPAFGHSWVQWTHA